MKSWKQSIIEGTILSLFVFAIIERVFTGSINVVNFFSNTFGYHVEANSMEIASMKGGIGLILSWILSGILTWFRLMEINFWHFISAFLGLFIYAGYLTSLM